MLECLPAEGRLSNASTTVVGHSILIFEGFNVLVEGIVRVASPADGKHLILKGNAATR